MSTGRRNVFLKTWWSSYLGEKRPFHDNYIYSFNNECLFSGIADFIPPTPSPTPTQTNTPTPSVTPTLTPTNTTSVTPTNTPTNTSSPTNTTTQTPSVTPTLTPTNTASVTPTNTTTATPSVSPTQTPSVTPTQTRVVFSQLFYSASSLCDACDNIGGGFVTLYYTGSCIDDTIGKTLFTNSSLSNPAPDGNYSFTGLCSNPNLEVGCQLNSGDGSIDFFQLCSTCVTPTPSPTVTNTQTPSVTPTLTPTNTTSPTTTPGLTPTPNAICPDQIQISGIVQTGVTDFNGVYTRIYSYTGGTFVGGYSQSITPSDDGTFYTGTMAETGLLYAVYEKISGSTYHTLLMRDQTGGTQPTISYSWGIIKTTGTSEVNGGVRIVSLRINPQNGSGIESSGVYYPQSGIYANDALVSYPSVCPTTTPTNTPSPTPSG